VSNSCVRVVSSVVSRQECLQNDLLLCRVYQSQFTGVYKSTVAYFCIYCCCPSLCKGGCAFNSVSAAQHNYGTQSQSWMLIKFLTAVDHGLITVTSTFRVRTDPHLDSWIFFRIQVRPYSWCAQH